MHSKGTLDDVTKEFDRWIEQLGIKGDVGAVQQTAFLGTARLLSTLLEV